MWRLYNSLTCNELSGFGSVTTLKTLVIILAAAAPVAGCATVSVYQPVTAEVSLSDGQSQLHAAAEAFSKAARDKGLAVGEASLASLADMLSGKQSDADAYWRRVGADKAAPSTVITRLRVDMGASAKGLSDLDAMAQALIGSGDPARIDVSAFERALIHARQSRDSFSDALVQINRRSTSEYQIALELAPLDKALAHARVTADDLAAARADAGQTASS
jgi:hypothetical protein